MIHGDDGTEVKPILIRPIYHSKLEYTPTGNLATEPRGFMVNIS
jgi:hypothetical protein